MHLQIYLAAYDIFETMQHENKKEQDFEGTAF